VPGTCSDESGLGSEAGVGSNMRAQAADIDQIAAPGLGTEVGDELSSALRNDLVLRSKKETNTPRRVKHLLREVRSNRNKTRNPHQGAHELKQPRIEKRVCGNDLLQE
jgi:hypothetical protein